MAPHGLPQPTEETHRERLVRQLPEDAGVVAACRDAMPGAPWVPPSSEAPRREKAARQRPEADAAGGSGALPDSPVSLRPEDPEPAATPAGREEKEAGTP